MVIEVIFLVVLSLYNRTDKQCSSRKKSNVLRCYGDHIGNMLVTSSQLTQYKLYVLFIVSQSHFLTFEYIIDMASLF